MARSSFAEDSCRATTVFPHLSPPARLLFAPASVFTVSPAGVSVPRQLLENRCTCDEGSNDLHGEVVRSSVSVEKDAGEERYSRETQ